MAQTDAAAAPDIAQRIADLEDQVSELKAEMPEDMLTLGVMSGDLDGLIASFVIALGAAAYDMKVNMFFTFWGTAALRDPEKRPKKKLVEKMFGWMMPKGSRKLPLSRMNMAGMGPKMIRSLMKKKGVASLEDMLEEAAELGINIYICEMSMDLMGFQREEMVDYPDLTYCGVGTFIGLASESKQTFFM
jgi:peroxiredoxin family protein